MRSRCVRFDQDAPFDVKPIFESLAAERDRAFGLHRSFGFAALRRAAAAGRGWVLLDRPRVVVDLGVHIATRVVVDRDGVAAIRIAVVCIEDLVRTARARGVCRAGTRRACSIIGAVDVGLDRVPSGGTHLLSVLANAQTLCPRRFGSTNRAGCTAAGARLDRARLDPARPRVLVREVARRRHAAARLIDGGRTRQTARQLKAETDVRFGAVAIGKIVRPILLPEVAPAGAQETSQARRFARRARQCAARTRRTFGRSRGAREERFRHAAVVARHRDRRCSKSLVERDVCPTRRGLVRTDKSDGTITVRAIDGAVLVVVESVLTILGHARSAARTR